MATVANALPPGWGYELISPAETSGADIFNAIGSADDQHAWVYSVTPTSSEQRTGNIDVLAASRTSSGWHLQDLAEPFPADRKSYSYILQGRSPDASESLVAGCEQTAVGCVGDTRFERVGSDGSRTTVLTVPAIGFGLRDPLLVGSSSDLSRFIVQEAAPPSGEHLVAQDTHTQGYGLYLAHDGQIEFLGVDENDAVLDCGAVLGNGDTAGFEQTGLSADGETIAFTSPDPGSGCPDTPEVYVRRDGRTFNISRPRIAGHPDQGARWAGSSQDGSTVFFVTTSQLVATDTDSANDIYAYHVATDSVTRITPGADVQTVQVSPAGDYVYFTATNPVGGQGTLGESNIYLYHAGIITFIATAPNSTTFLGQPMTFGGPSLATPDGRFLLFYSTARLAGPPTNGNTQLFQYSTLDQQLRCISCHPDGTAPNTSTVLPRNVSPFQGAVDLRLQSDDGQTVVFETHERLLPEDVNNTLDIYLWQHGTLSLISDPHVENDLGSLASTTATGNTVYFKSGARLTPDAQQDNLKMYAARLGGGFPVPPPQPACQDDACQGPPTAPPTSPPPTSTTLGGLGNLTTVVPSPVTKAALKPLTAAQKLTRALKACRTQRKRPARKKCESRARRHYPQAAKRATHRHRGGTADASH